MVTLPWREKKPVVVYFFAESSLQSKDVEEQVLSQPVVKERLEAFTMIYVNVTEADAGEQELRQVLKGWTMPKAHVFASGGELAASLRAGEEPVPKASIDKVVGVDEFLVMLASGR